ncbi:MAG: nucleoside hydrolase, partial [Clostridiales bacterium]|nr:nucleoside hydrolase [Clostridiales bacterium]
TNTQDISIVPLEKPVLTGQDFVFSLQENNTKGLKIKWDMGDGSTATGASVNHVYSKPGIYHVSVYLDRGSNSVKQSSLIIRVHTPETLKLPQVFLDTDARCEADDQHFIAYCLYSELDVLGINSIHNDEVGSEAINYGEIFNIMKLMNISGMAWDSMPTERVFHGATEKLTPPANGVWYDTEPIVTEGSEAILAAARGASPGNPLVVLPVGPCTNIASAVLQARKEGFELRDRIRVIWLGGLEKGYSKEYNGGNDPWSVYVMGQTGIDIQVLLSHPTSLKLNIDKRIESGLYPDNELGEYLVKITPVFQWGSTTVLKSIHDACVPATVISNFKGFNWVTKVAPVKITGPEKDYKWEQADSTSAVYLIWDIDGEAMKADLFNTLNGNPTSLMKK